MVYSTQKCPHCKGLLNYQTNPQKQIANPFEKCPHCGKIYKNSYKEEWLTKSPFKRVLFLIDNIITYLGIFASLIIAAIVSTANSNIFIPVFIIAFVLCIIGGYIKAKNDYQFDINESLKRTEVKEYVKLLEKAGYTIYPIEGVKYACRKQDTENVYNDVDSEKNTLYKEHKNNVQINENFEKAKKYFQMAEDLNDSEDVDEAIQLYIKASDLGHDEADIALGYIYLNGKGKRKNKTKALEYFKKAQLKGNIYADKIIAQISDKETE